MANTIVRVPITGDAIDVETTEIEVSAGDTVVLSLEPSVTGKITIGSSSDGVLVLFQKGPHNGPDVKDPPQP